MSYENNNYIIEDHVKGTTWYGISFLVTETQEDESELPVDFTGAEVVAQFKKGKSGPVVFEFTTEDDQIVFGTEDVSDPKTGEIVIKVAEIDYPAFDYYVSIKATFLDARTDEIVEGYWKIVN